MEAVVALVALSSLGVPDPCGCVALEVVAGAGKLGKEVAAQGCHGAPVVEQ